MYLLKLLFIFITSSLIGFSNLHALPDFEGVVNVVFQEMEFSKKDTIQFFVKSRKVSIRLPKAFNKNATKLLANLETGEFFVTRKRDMQTITLKYSLDAYIAYMNSIEPGKTELNVEVEKTEELKEIDENECYKVVFENQQFSGEAWIADLENDFTKVFPALQIPEKWMLLKFEDGLPLQISLTERISGNKKEVSYQIEKKAIDESVFDIPKENHIVDMKANMEKLKDHPSLKEMMKQLNDF